MHKILVIIFLFFLTSGYCLQEAPWYGDVYEFHFLSKYTYSRYSKVNNSLISLDGVSNDDLLHFNLSFSPSLQCSIDSDLEFFKSPRQDFGFSSVGFQARYLLKDDIIGDPVSISMGGNFRVVSKESLHDVSVLYHSNVNFEFNLALGKEFSKMDYWRFRFWLYGAGGIANQGSPWLRGNIFLEGNIQERKKWAFFLNAMQSYGRKEKVDIYDFNGYGKIRQSNIDLGIRYGIRFNVWGTFSAEYKRRVLAKRCPQGVNFISLIYVLPFSF